MNKNKKQQTKNIVLCAGGSGGHIFPAEALATELQKKGFNIFFLTDKRGQTFKDKNFSIYQISGEAVTGKTFFKKLIALTKIALGVIQAFCLFRKLKPLVVIGFGGFASIPGATAAILSRIPLVIHEQNAVLGKANHLLARKASLILTSFPETKKLPLSAKVKYVGMPVRPEIANKAAYPYPNLDLNSPINLLIIGGSQGAAILSKVIPDALKMLPVNIKKRLKVSQQCRPEDINNVREAFIGSGIDNDLAPFFNDIPDRMANAHLIISRSGSSSIAEIFTIGRPAILIPFAKAADDHQTVNALALTDSGGGFLIPEKSFSAENLNERLLNLFKNPEILKKAASCALVPDMPKVSQKLCEIIEKDFISTEKKK